jgi:hypothetical protein
VVKNTVTIPNPINEPIHAISPQMTHAIQTINPTNGIKARHTAQPNKHKNAIVTNAKAKIGTVIKINEINVRIIQSETNKIITKIVIARKRAIPKIKQITIVIANIIPRQRTNKSPNTNPATHRRAQRPHPTTIAKIMIARIMRTAMLSMNRIIGTTIKPSQLIKMAGI